MEIIEWINKVELSFDSDMKRDVGDIIKLSAEAFGGDEVEYQFSVELPNQKMAIVSNYSAKSDCEFELETPGLYNIFVKIREKGTLSDYEAFHNKRYTLEIDNLNIFDY